MVSEDAIILTSSSSMVLLECTSSSLDFNIADRDIVWFSISRSILNFVNVSNCTSIAEGSGSGSGSETFSNPTNSNTDNNQSNAGDFNALPEGLMELSSGSSMYNASDMDFPNGGYVICVVNNTDLGRCLSDFTTVTGTLLFLLPFFI